MSYLSITTEQSKSLTVENNIDHIILYDPHESVLANSIYAKNEFEASIYNEFESLKEDWLAGIRFDSGYHNLVNHPSYLKIISMGEIIIPILVRDMINNRIPWFYALEDITGEDPIREESIGRLDELIQDWTDWAEENSYV